MPDLQQLLDATTAHEKLRAIPGVERIGFGLKEKGGKVLPEYVFRVYVRWKRPISDLSPEEVIPAEVEGIKTDVVVLHDTELHCQTNLAPGKQITREVLNAEEASGTLGCIVVKGSSTYILTNEHVIVPEDTTSQSQDVYQPKKSTCAGFSCNSPVATVVAESSPWAIREMKTFDGKSYWVDAGLIQINPDVARSNTIDGIGPINAQIRDLALEPSTGGSTPGSSAPAVPIPIHKRGAITDVTHGTVVEFCHQQTIEGSPVTLWEMIILPGSGYHYSETYRISTDESRSLEQIISIYTGEPVTATRVNPNDVNDRRIHFEGTVFSMKGDSGSICVDDARHASGLLYANRGLTLNIEGETRPVFIPSGRSISCYIKPVLLALSLNLSNAIFVSASPASGAILVQPGDTLTIGSEPNVDLAEAVNRFGEKFQKTTGGQHLLEIFREYHREVLDLINRRRHVTVAWQRGKGPAFVAAFLNAIQLDEQQIPKRVAGHSIEELIEQMNIAFQQEGSDRLRQAIEQEREFISQLVSQCETFDDLFHFLKKENFDGLAARLWKTNEI